MWSDMTPRERDALVGVAFELHEPGCPAIADDESDEVLGDYQRCVCNWLSFTASLDACRLVEGEIAKRGLIEKYQTALIELLDLDMQVFNSAIELNTYNTPNIPNNTFEWEGHAYLWQYTQATAEHRCHAALRAMGVEV